MYHRSDPSLVLLPDLRFNGDALVATECTYTEAHLEPVAEYATTGIKRPAGDVVALGTPTEAFDSTLTTLIPGACDSVGTFAYTDAGVTYGRNGLNEFNGFELVRTGSDGYYKPNSLALSNGYILVAYENADDNGVYVTRRATNGTWTPVSVWVQSDLYDPNFAPNPALAQRGTTVYCASLERMVGTPDAHLSLRIDASTDSGATWSLHVRHALDLDAGVYVDQMRLVYDRISQNMYLFMIHRAGGPTYALHWYVSLDLGASWTERDSIADVERCDAIAVRGRVILCTIEDGVTDAVQVYNCDMSGTLNRCNDVGLTARPLAAAHLALSCDESSVVRLYTMEDDTNQYLWSHKSVDGGRSFTAEDSALVTTCTLSDGELRPFSAVSSRGSIWILGSPSSGATPSAQILAYRFGGITNVTHDVYETWTSQALPTDSGWTNVGDTGSISQMSLDVAPVAMQSYWYKEISLIQQPRVLLAFARVKGYTNSSSLNDSCILRLRQDAPGPNMFSASLRISEGDVRVYDESGVELAHEPVYSGYMDYLFAMDQLGVVSAWFKSEASETWETLCVNQATVAISGTVNQCSVTFGNSQLLSNAESKWRFVSIQYQPFLTGNSIEQLPAFNSATYEPLGIPCTTMPHYVGHGCSVQWRVPPESRSDSWVFRSVSRASFERSLCASTVPSPVIWYEGEGVASTEYHATFDFGSTYKSRLSRNLAWIGCVGVRGIESISLSRYNGSTYATLATLDLSESLTLLPRVVRSSTTSTCFGVGTTGSGVSRLYPEDSLVGLYIRFTNSSNSKVTGRIKHNKYGQIASTDTLWIDLDPDTITGTLSTWGTSVSGGPTAILLYHDCGACIFEEDAESTRYYRISWTVAPFGAGLDRIGWIGAGQAHMLARTERSGATVEQVDGVALETLGSNVTLAHLLSKPKRVWTLNYEQLLQHPNREAGGTLVSRVGFGSTERGYTDNNRDIVNMMQHGMSRMYPFLFVPGVYDWTDPGTTGASVLGADSVALVRMQDMMQSVTNRSRLYSRREVASTSANLTLTEEV